MHIIKKDSVWPWESVGTASDKERLIDEKEASSLFGFEAPPHTSGDDEIKRVLSSIKKT